MAHTDGAFELHVERPRQRTHERAAADHAGLRPAEHRLRVRQRELDQRLGIDEHLAAEHGTVHHRLLEDAYAVADNRAADDRQGSDLDVAPEHRGFHDGGRMNAAAAASHRQLLQHLDDDGERAHVSSRHRPLRGAESHPRPAAWRARQAGEGDPDRIQVRHPHVHPTRNLERHDVADGHAHVTHRVDAARKGNRDRARAGIDDRRSGTRQQRAHRRAGLAAHVEQRIGIRALTVGRTDQRLLAGELRERGERPVREGELAGGAATSCRGDERRRESRTRIEIVAKQQELPVLDRVVVVHVADVSTGGRERFALPFRERAIRDRRVAGEVAERLDPRVRPPAIRSQRHDGGCISRRNRSRANVREAADAICSCCRIR